MPFPVTQQNEPHTQDVTIAAAGTLTPVFILPAGHEIAAILMPAVWTAAAITFQAGITATALGDAFTSAGAEVSLTIAAAHCIPLAPALLHGALYYKIRSGTTGSPVAQAAERVLTLITRPTA